jgi:hypothetical protein
MLVVAFTPGRGVSQRLPTPFHSVHAADLHERRFPPEIAPEPGIHSPLLAAAGLGVLGVGVGVLAGVAIGNDCGSWCTLGTTFLGAGVGGGIGLAVGAHLGNRSRGNLGLDLAASGVVWGVGLAAMLIPTAPADSGGGARWPILLALPVAQLVATVLVERATGRARARRAPEP